MNKNQEYVNVTIRAMHGQFAASGVELDGDELRVPKLRPREVVAIPADSILLDCEALEISRAQPTRPFAFANMDEVAAYKRGEYRAPVEKAKASATTSSRPDVEGATDANAHVRDTAPTAHSRRAAHG